MGDIMSESIGRATSIPRKLGVVPEEWDSAEGIESSVTGKTKKEARKEGVSSFLTGSFFK